MLSLTQVSGIEGIRSQEKEQWAGNVEKTYHRAHSAAEPQIKIQDSKFNKR
jgi:hypothetical protein